MANYGYLHLKCKISADNFETLLRDTVSKTLRGNWVVKRADFAWDGITWIVEIPDAEYPAETKAVEAPGFVVSLAPGDKQILFRHSLFMFESWAQGCIEEALADYFQVGVLYDASDEIVPPGTVEYRRGKTFREYLSRNFDKPLSLGDKEWIERFEPLTPKGYW